MRKLYAAFAFLLMAGSVPRLVADVLVFDRAAKTVSRLDASSLLVRASAPLPDVPARAVVSPDGSTVVVLCRGKGKDKSDGFKAETKAQAIVLEASSLRERARVELGWGLGPAIWDAAGNAVVILSPGFPSTNPKNRQTASVVSIDRAGTVRRVPLERASVDMAVAPDGQVVAVLSPRVEGPAQLVFADLSAGASGGAVFLQGEPKELLLAPDGATLYVLSRGWPRGSGDVPGSVAVFSMPERRKTGDLALSAITAIGGFDRTGRLVLGGAKAGGVKEHRIYVIRGGVVEFEVKGPQLPASFRFSPDGRTAWVLGWDSAFVDFGDFTSPPTVSPVKISGGGPSFERTPDGKHVLTYDSDGQGRSEVLIYELPSGKKLKSFDTASFGSRLGAGLAAAGATLGSMEAGRRDAVAHGRSTYTYTIYAVKTDVSHGAPIVLRPDGKVAFVYDPLGSDVLSINLETLEKGKRLNGGKGSRGLFLTGDGKTLLLASEEGLSVFDTAVFDKPTVTKTDGPADIAMGPSGETLLLAKGLLAVIEPATGKIAAQTTSLLEPAIGAFLP